jgi:hypothetical protein
MRAWWLSVTGAVSILLLIAGGCKDMGKDVVGGSPGLIVSSNSVSVEPGDDKDVMISGGAVPYSIVEAPQATVASAQFVNPAVNPATLTITANASASPGSASSVTVRDNSTPPRQVTISITIEDLSLVATPSSVTVGSGQQVNITISNGTPPYEIDDSPNPNLASAAFVNANVTPATLTITGANNPSATGSTTVKIKDSRQSPEREIRVHIMKIP